MNTMEKLRLLRELTTLRKTITTATLVQKLQQARRITESRKFLGANQAPEEAPAPVAEKVVPQEGEARVSTSDFYADAKPKGISRQRLNNRAVDILRQVEADPSKVVTEDEKKSLALFSGYGGGLVDPEGKKGSAFEYYTPKGIAEGIWGALEGLGFKGGKVLDPSAGTGIFGATAPLSCVVDAVELSQYSGRVNQLVNNGPGYQCTISNFEKVAANTPDEIYDAVVTNVPFGDKLDRGTAYVDDPRYQDEPLENYFILRSLEKLRPNGMAAFIVPTRVISGKGGKPESLRHSASLMAEFVGAYRLPTGTFSNADTDTVTDVIFFRKYSADVLEKIKELAEQNAAVLSEANVMWGPFLDGKYFESAEGKPYVLGEFVAKDPTKFRDTDKVISNAGISDLKEILQTRRLPRSRVNWDMLEAAETSPIVYEDGDTVTQAGVTLVMRDGVWVAMPKDNSDQDVAARLSELANPYAAFEAGRDWQEVEDTIEAADNLGLYSQVPQWLRSARTELKPLSPDERRKIWPKGVAGLAVRQVIEERRNDQGISFESEYPALTAALKRLGITQADTRKVKGAMSVGMKTARIHYSKKTGISDFWAGKISAEVAKTDAVTQALDTPEAKFAAYRYEHKNEWIPVDMAAAVLGEGVDPLENDDYCISADGKTFTTAANYYVGNYKDFLDRIDAQIEAASDERVKSKLLRQRERADSHLHHLDFSSMTFTLASPLVTAEEKLQFLKTFVSEYAQIEIDDETGKPYVTVRVPNAKTDNEKLLNRFGQYLKNGSVTLGGAELSMSEKSAFKWLRKLISQSNEQFNTWSRANPAVMGRIQAKANNPKNLRFETAESADIGHIPGMKASLKLHDYQAEFVSKMGREFSGINGFGVGLGKTFCSLAAVQHVQAIGVKKKTLFVVPNSVLSNWRKEASRAYESIDDCLFVGLRFDKNGKPSVKAADYDEDLERIRENRHAKIFMSMEAFERIKLKKETLEEYASYMGSVDESFRGSESKKKDEQVKAKRQGVLDILGNKTGAAPYLEDLGIDSIVIDEAHFYKNSANVNSFKGAQYLSLSPASKRGLDAQAKTWYIRGQSPLNDGVLLLTATPITNSPLEIYSMMSLAVGPERVNDAACGVRGADAFMETFCHKESKDAHMVDGTVKAKNVFVGLNNVDCLRNVITGIATIKNAKDVGATVRVPDRDELETAVTLDDKQQTKLKLYKEAYGWAVDTLRDVPEDDRRGSQAAYDAVQGRFNEDMELIGHPFNLINKMTMVIADPELDERATFYDFAESDRALVDKVVSQFNAKKIKEKRSSGSGPWTDEDAVHQKAVKDEDGESAIIYEVDVRASVISGNRIVVDTMDAKTQTVFEEMAEKAGLDLDVRSSAKISAMLENFKKEMAHPRGMIDDGVKSPIVKQIIFCDILALHNKIKRLLSKRCGIPAGKIAIVTGQINSSVEEIQAVQDGFNAQGEDNRYQVIIANKKAEVGINLQKGTQAIHHLTIGWTPDSLEQRNGRGARQGNKTEKVSIYYYNADGTFDAVKKDMVSHKGEWITNVTTAGGGNRVNIEGGMSNEDMEILINSSGDKDAVEKARAAKAEADRQKRIQETKTRQATNVDTYLKQKQYLEKYTGPEVIAQEQIVAYWQLLQAFAKAEKNLKTAEAAGKKTDLQNRRYTNLKTRVDQLKNELSNALILKEDDEEVTLDYAVNRASNYRRRVTEDDVRRYVKYRLKITVKEDSGIYADWASSVEQAKSMMEESIKSFAADAKEEGGQPADLMQAVADGRAFVSPNNTVVTVGSFVMNKPNDVLAMVIDVRSDDYVFTYIPADAQHFNSKRAYITPPIIVYPGTSGYDECLRRAAKLEDDLVSKNPSADMLFSQTVPEIANYRQTKLLDWHNISSTLLPDPYFSYVITPSEAETGPIKKQLFESQKTIVKDFNDDFFGVEPGTELIDSAPWNYRTNKALSVMIYAKTHHLKLTPAECENFDLYVQTAVRKIPEDDLDGVIRRELVREDRMVRITIGGYIRSRLDEFIDVSSVDDLALYDFLGVSQKRAIQFAINMITPVEPEEDEPEEEPEEETPREERDDDTLAITGNTYPWKNQIKEAAQSVGEKAKWSRMLTCWLISRKAWKALIKASPAAANELFAKTA